MKWLTLFVGSLVLLVAAVFTAVKFGSFEVQRLQRENERLEQERRRLLDYAERLSASRRVAQVEVVRQRVNEGGHVVSTLLWQEIGADGTLGKPLAVEVVGNLVYFEAAVIKFERRYVQEADSQRGTSLAMFRRIFGDQQAPESVADLDRTARPPTRDPAQNAAFQDELWSRFWEMIDDPSVAARYGVRVVQCEAPALPLKANEIIEATVDAAGGINLKKIGTRPLDGSAPANPGRAPRP